AWRAGTKLAVAAVSVPHLVGTTLRLWRLWPHVDRRVLLSFGVASAAGGLAGALLHVHADSPALAVVLGVLLVFAGVAGLTGLATAGVVLGPRTGERALRRLPGPVFRRVVAALVLALGVVMFVEAGR